MNIPSLTKTEKKQLQKLAREELKKREMLADYKAYCEFVHRGRWFRGRAVSFICDKAQEFIERKTTKPYEILVLSMPPQHGKSMTITETLPSWFLMKNPDGRVIEISYSEDFAQLFGRRNRSKINEFGSKFGVQLAKTPNSNLEFEIDGKAGGMISRGILSGVTGRACDLMIIDDPIKNRQEADSETYRNRLWDEWVNSFRSRLAAGAKVIVIQTRWHEDDFAGRLIKQEPNVEVINLPCRAEEKDPLGRKPGEALAPEIGKDDAWLEQFEAGFKTSDGSRAWEALYQGRPTNQEGNLLKREWWQYYDSEKLPEMITEIISVDATFKSGDDNDFVAIQCWGKRDANIYLIEAVKKHLDFVETLREIRRMKARRPKVSAILVEDKANGPAVIQVLRREIPGVIGIDPKGGKVARVNAVSPAIESGNVFLPKDAPFTADFVNECAAFPNGAHDDQVDCMSQALNRFIYRKADAPITQKIIHYDFKSQKPKKNPLGKGDKIHVV
ncbi:MAG: phage terminase large subunit [Christensenellales bacterium]